MAKKAGTIPFQIIDEQIWICLVSSRKRKNKFILPKGTVRTSEDMIEAAKRETLEEAGLKGEMSHKSVKIKAKSADKEPVLHSIKFFPLSVVKIKEKWPEKKHRKRLWINYDDLPKAVMVKRDIAVIQSRRFKSILKNMVNRSLSSLSS